MSDKIDVQEMKLTSKDFQSDQDVRWCPGCGDYGILNAIKKTFDELGIDPRELEIEVREHGLG